MRWIRTKLPIIIPIILVIALAVVCVNLWQHKTIEENDLKVMCKSSVNILYGYMTMKPEEVKANIFDLIDALEYLAEDYDHPNGFNLINALNNKIAAE